MSYQECDHQLLRFDLSRWRNQQELDFWLTTIDENMISRADDSISSRSTVHSLKLLLSKKIGQPHSLHPISIETLSSQLNHLKLQRLYGFASSTSVVQTWSSTDARSVHFHVHRKDHLIVRQSISRMRTAFKEAVRRFKIEEFHFRC